MRKMFPCGDGGESFAETIVAARSRVQGQKDPTRAFLRGTGIRDPESGIEKMLASQESSRSCSLASSMNTISNILAVESRQPQLEALKHDESAPRKKDKAAQSGRGDVAARRRRARGRSVTCFEWRLRRGVAAADALFLALTLFCHPASSGL